MHVIGAGGHAKVVIDIIKSHNNKIEGVWAENCITPTFLDYPLNNYSEFKQLNTHRFIIAIGNNQVRKRIANELMTSSAEIVHPSCSLSASVVMGAGCVCMANTTINADVVIGDHVIINSNASVDHDCKIANFVHISPQVGLAGNVTIGEGTHVGIGATVIPGVKIGKWATIGAGAVVIRDVPDYAVVVGNPGKIIKYNKIED
ncbi:acetyltransferase [Pedobacter insulae]|uniref:Transferase hexapeptide (Six repeat-containing protein) n=1 Tax=Pedobacter insulae TaxID=414048 RepID=A0A1I2TJX0_9SPHI|nr:acetyltransferase [Pedobacter insulae]SFG62786.1 transferase hexapeptide (six repeat-containing protein) [Pedobacter insulae]